MFKKDIIIQRIAFYFVFDLDILDLDIAEPFKGYTGILVWGGATWGIFVGSNKDLKDHPRDTDISI